MTKWLALVSVASCGTTSYYYVGATLQSSTTATHLDLVLEEPGILLLRIAQEQIPHRSGKLDGRPVVACISDHIFGEG